jgi:hypothetical protein
MKGYFKKPKMAGKNPNHYRPGQAKGTSKALEKIVQKVGCY